MAEQIIVAPSAVESFLDSTRAAQVWPQDIATNAMFVEQIEKRQILRNRLNRIFACLPEANISLEAAISLEFATADQVTQVYESLSDLLETDRDYKRLILYLPFEFLPSASWQPKETALKQAIGRFRQAYLSAWIDLLSLQDVRANFIDGDILETEQQTGELPRVVKAAHLIPKLVEAGLIKASNVIGLIEENTDETFRTSVADTLPVLFDLGLLTKSDLKLMNESTDELVAKIARVITASRKDKKRLTVKKLAPITLATVQKRLTKELFQIEKGNYGDITEKRKKWLIQKGRREAIESLGQEISLAIIEQQLPIGVIADFLAPETDSVSRQTLAEGIRQAIEAVAVTDFGQAQTLYARYHSTLQVLWSKNDPETNEVVAKAFRRLYQLELTNDEQLAKLGITLPRLAGPFSDNLPAMKNETDLLQELVAAITAHPELSRLIYPTFVVYGSRLKGYGETKSDIDLGIFVRPETPLTSRDKIHDLLKTVCDSYYPADEITEFWLEEKSGRFQIRDFDDWDKTLGGSYWTHVLFGGAWVSEQSALTELRQKLLAPYLYETDQMIMGRKARGLHLQELERDTLQYRLMHKGYQRFYPPCGGLHVWHADNIDGHSMFWDSGYRQLATKLFLSRVFLPKLPEKQ